MSQDVLQASDNDQKGRIGVAMVALAVHQELGWIFREKPTSDIGIDGEIETREGANKSHGRIVAVQIKCGASYLREQTAEAIKFRGDYKHLRYWATYSAPVLIVLCDPTLKVSYWQTVDLQHISFHEQGWSIEVPKSNILNSSAITALQKIAARLQKKDLIELALRDWIGWRFQHQMRLASSLSAPRDYWWFSHLGAIGGDYYMVDYVFSGVDGFEQAQVDKVVNAIQINRREYDYRNVLLAFISESLHYLQILPQPPTIPNVRIEYVPLLLDLEAGPRLRELGTNGALIVDYEFGATDESFRQVSPARKISIG